MFSNIFKNVIELYIYNKENNENFEMFCKNLSGVLIKCNNLYLNVFEELLILLSCETEIYNYIDNIECIIYYIMKWIRSFRIIGDNHSFTKLINFIQIHYHSYNINQPISYYINYIHIWLIYVYSPLYTYFSNNMLQIETEELNTYSLSYIHFITNSLVTLNIDYIYETLQLLCQHINNYYYILKMNKSNKNLKKNFICIYQITVSTIVNNFGILITF